MAAGGGSRKWPPPPRCPDPDASPLGLDDLAADGEPQARALPLRLGREEGLEDPRADLGGDAGARVGHAQDGRARRPGNLDAEGAARGHGIDGIGEEIEDDLLHLGAVDQDLGKRVAGGEAAGDALTGQHGCHEIGHALDEGVEVRRLHAPRQALRGRHAFLDRADQALDLSVDGRQPLTVLIGETRAPPQELQVHGDGVEGRADLVGNGRGHVAHRRQTLGAAEFPLQVEERLGRLPQGVITLLQLLGRLGDSLLEVVVEPVDLRHQPGVLGVALPDPVEHGGEALGEASQFVVMVQGRLGGQIATLDSTHRPQQAGDRAADVLLAEQCQPRDDGRTGDDKHHQELSAQVQGQPVRPLDGNGQGDRAHRLPIEADRGGGDPDFLAPSPTPRRDRTVLGNGSRDHRVGFRERSLAARGRWAKSPGLPGVHVEPLERRPGSQDVPDLRRQQLVVGQFLRGGDPEGNVGGDGHRPRPDVLLQRAERQPAVNSTGGQAAAHRQPDHQRRHLEAQRIWSHGTRLRGAWVS